MNRFSSGTGDYWTGYDDLTRLFIFGDSYSAVGYNTGCPAPTEEQPFGITFPGYTWTEGGESGMGDSTNPNWVGHLITSRRKDGKKLLVYDYAVGGHTLSGVRHQIENSFLPHAGTKPEWAPWNAEESLFITWVGINDCAFNAEHGKDIEKLFDLEEELYQNGARNFLLIDVPPIHRSPAFARIPGDRPNRDKSFVNWNTHLHKGAQAFHAKHSDISLLMYSSWDIFEKINENPKAFGFSKSDLKKAGGKIWVDHIHPTTRVHAILADDMDSFMKGYQSEGKTGRRVIHN